jgi:predicted ATPase/DNA-binding XRE family transcriptional regulator
MVPAGGAVHRAGPAAAGADGATFGLLLRRARSAAALSQEQLAARAGMSARAVSDLERGVHRRPHLESVRLLADALALDAAGRAALLEAARTFPVDPTARRELRRLAPLPVPPTRLVGRGRERAVLTDLLRGDEVRLVTLTGPGGSGKTRLAIAVAEGVAVADAFPDGVGFVDLAPITDPGLVATTIAHAVGERAPGAAEATDALVAVLEGKRLLLVLDNMEHVIEAAPVVAVLLGSLPDLRVLATSREPLRLRGEREFPVPPLPLPEPPMNLDGAPDLATMATSEAVTLFVERARDARPDFALDAGNAAAVAAICRRLDGLPLALELAAARLRGLPLLALHERLERSLPLLVGGPRDAPARQRSLQETIAWSYDGLPAAEQTLCRRLGVFANGWTIAAAEAVTPLGDDLDVLAVLGSLADKHLIRLDETRSEPRYRMLETIREFARDRLAEDGDEQTAARRAHAAYYAALVDAAGSGLSIGVLADVARVDADLDNLRAALAWLIEDDAMETALPLAGRLGDYWTFSGGHFAEGRAWLERVVARGATASASARAAGYFGIAILAIHQADLGAARAAATAGLELARAANDPRLISINAYQLGSVEASEGRREEAMALAREALAAARAAGDAGEAAWAWQLLGIERHAAGDLAGAVAAFEEALAIFRDATGRVPTLERLALTTRALGDPRRAAALFGEALALRSGAGAVGGMDGELIGLADLALAAGRPAAAARLLGAADAFDRRLGYAPFRDLPALKAETLAAAKQRLDPAAFAQAWEEGSALPPDDALAEALALAAALAA